MGYHNGSWEFCRSGASIHGEVEQLGGVANLKVQPPHFIVSDDTILHIATAEGLTSEWSGDRYVGVWWLWWGGVTLPVALHSAGAFCCMSSLADMLPVPTT